MTLGSRPVFFEPPSDSPQMLVISEPEYVVGTARRGKLPDGADAEHHPRRQAAEDELSHSASILLSRISLPSLSDSACTNLRNSSGELERTSKPRSASRCRTSGTSSVRAISFQTRMEISLRIPAGASSPNHEVCSKPG